MNSTGGGGGQATHTATWGGFGDLKEWEACRNAYNDLYHWTARYSFLEKLISEGREMYNVVYIDPDILIMQVRWPPPPSPTQGKRHLLQAVWVHHISSHIRLLGRGVTQYFLLGVLTYNF